MKACRVVTVLALAMVTPLAACGLNGRVPTVAPSPSASPVAPARYGASQTIQAGSGVVKVAVGRPEVVTLHSAAPDPRSTAGKLQGPASKPMVRVLVTVEGVSGRIAAIEVPTLGLYLSYVVGGVEAQHLVPTATFEDPKPLSESSTMVGAGSHLSGYLYFQTSNVSGRVVATLAGVPDTRPLAIWQS